MEKTKTSFNQLTKSELLEVASQFSVEVNPNENKETVIAALVTDGITWDFYQSFVPDEEAKDPEEPLIEDAPVADLPIGQTVVVKMTRANASYEAAGVRFTREHPYAMVSEEDAEFLVNKVGGFQPALASEIQKYYA